MGISRHYQSGLPCPPWNPQDCARRLLKHCLFLHFSFQLCSLFWSELSPKTQGADISGLAWTAVDVKAHCSFPAPPLWVSQSPRFAHISLTAWHDILGLIQSRPPKDPTAWNVPLPPAAQVVFLPFLPAPPPHTPFWLLLCPAFVYKLPEVESLPHHGTHSAPRTAPEPVEALLPVPPTPDQPFQIQVRVHLLGLILMPDPAQNLDS